VRSFAQDDAHVFCTEDQVEDEVQAMIEMTLGLYSAFGFEDVTIELSTRPEKSIGTAEMWEHAEKALQSALEHLGYQFTINPGEGAFYGPKIDFHIADALGRRWQLGTVQLDYQMPERFDLSYIGSDSAEHRPVMIHRAMLGSIERFMGILIEHTGGAFPVWMAPVQAVVLPVSEKFAEYGAKVCRRLQELGIRAELDSRNEKLGYRIREAQMQKIPYMLVMGAKEQESGQVSVRLRSGEDLGPQDLEEVTDRILTRARERSNEL
jgi:threonyl-tRNA synthetase